MSPAMTERIIQAGEAADAQEKRNGSKLPYQAYAVHTSTKPLSMYGAPQWAMCFPQCFPYGDGVFGLPRANALTFQ